MKKFICIIGFCLVSTVVNAQVWTLHQCIDYALKNNIQLKQKQVAAEQSKLDVMQSKAALLPSLSASTNQNMSWRPWSQSTINLTGGTMTTTQSQVSYNGSYGLNANWTVWNGGKNTMNIKQNKYTDEMNELSAEQTANSIQEQITQLYVEILYQAEAVKVNESILEASQVACNRGKQMYELGSIAKSDYIQLESQVAQDNYNLITSRTQLDNYTFQLKQLLEITGDEIFKVKTEDITENDVLTPIPAKNDVYNTALSSRPEIKSGQLGVESSELAIKIAKAGYMPSVSLTAGIGTSNASANDNAVFKQIKTNVNNSLGLSLQIPIFDQRQNKTAVSKARLQHLNSQLALQEAEKDLYRQIENYWLNATNAQQQFIYAEASAKSAKENFDLLSEKFNLGMINIVELNTGKNNLLKAEQQYLEAKYTTLYNIAMLRFYEGKEINL
ncbi:MAG: TolC family protein [Bacteroidaceae bacterium]|nr:TolC family protein [Bacteroidaceae bacterium]